MITGFGDFWRKSMLRTIRIVFVLLIPFLAFAQINTSIINPVHTKLKILSVADNVISEDNYTLPDSGNKFISVKVLFDYTGCTTKAFPSFLYLKIIDPGKNFYQPSIKTFVVRKPYLNSTNVNTDRKTSGWATFEVPEKLSINSLKIKYERSNYLKSDWIPLWPVVSNAESAKKIAKQVSRERINSSFPAKQMILKKVLLSINNYINYTATNQPTYYIRGLENASHAKLLVESSKKSQLKTTSKKPPFLNNIVSVLSQDLPENILKQQSTNYKRNVNMNLRKLRQAVIKKYIQN